MKKYIIAGVDLHLAGYRRQRTTRHAVAAVGAAISCAVCFLISIKLLS